MNCRRSLLYLPLSILLAPLAGNAETPLPPPEIPAAHEHRHPAPATDAPEVGLTEKLGETIPLDLTFRDESGQAVTLRQLIDGPTIVAPVYYHCPDVCNFLQGDLARTLPKLKLQPGKDYRVLSVSFDETDTPATAAGSKRNYFAGMGSYPPDAWRFLTGEPAAIRALTDSLGYRFQRQGRDFLHPVAVAVVAGDGKIVRYLYGTRFLPMDLNLALVEASEGKVGVSVKRVLGFCFSYDPVNRRYVFNLLRVTAVVVVLTAGGFLAWLLLSGRKKQSDDDPNRPASNH
jgi:protein SCO1/2